MSNANDSKQARDIEGAFRWQTLLNQVKKGSKIVEIIQLDPQSNHKFEQCLINVLQTLSSEEQDRVEKLSLISVGVKPGGMDDKDFKMTKLELDFENLSLSGQHAYANQCSDPVTKIKFLTMASKNGNYRSQKVLASLLRTDGKIDDAIYWYTKASKQKDNGYCSAQLGYIYDLDKKDYALAVNWYLHAVEHGAKHFVQNNLGVCYEHGRGVEKNTTAAFQMYLDASKDLSHFALQNLGRCYALGIGTNCDPQLAFDTWTKAVYHGSQMSKECLATYFPDGNPRKIQQKLDKTTCVIS